MCPVYDRKNVFDLISQIEARLPEMGSMDTNQVAPPNSVPKRRSRVRTKKTKFTFIDLFAGIGGMRLGFEAAGGQCVATCERDKYSRKTYGENFEIRNHPFFEDVRDIDLEELPAHDVLLAGFPCQPFSIAGVSKKNALGDPHGFRCENQGNLFFNIADILERKRPQAFLLENVKNLLSHDKGRTFTVIRRVLEDHLQYNIQVRTIDAKGFVPQHRERVFIVGFRQETDFNLAGLKVPESHTGPKLSTILHPEDGSEIPEEPYTLGSEATVSPKYTLTKHLWNYLQTYAEKHRAAGNGFGFGLVGSGDTARTLSARYYKDGSEILIRQKLSQQPRRLTPRECARLMGFDSVNRMFNIPVSDTQAYKQFGNAVVVPVVATIAKAMSQHLGPSEIAKLNPIQTVMAV